ncbi:MAG: VWA domain-containing protein [Acidobacteriaceae bacterium]
MTRHRGLLYSLSIAGALFLLPNANAASCKTQSQLTAVQRDAISSAAHAMIADVQGGNVQALQANTIPVVAADFGGISSSAQNLKPLVQHATVTVDTVYTLDASSEPAGGGRTDFFCGNPVVVLNFTNLPPGKYGLVILHATGVAQPQQISLILSETAENHWMLAGFFSRPMVEAGHNGLWYWEQARNYAQNKMNWNAWFYYQAAASLLSPVDFLASPNLGKLRQEAERVRPQSLPGAQPMMLNAQGSAFQITSMGITGEFGGLDLEVHYIPDAAQAAQLRDPVAARKQVLGLMAGLLALHPELRSAFRGIWARADSGNASIYSLDLPMEQISATGQPAALPVQAQSTQRPTSVAAFDPTKSEPQPNLTLDRDPVLSPDPEDNAAVGATAPSGPGKPGEIQKGKGGIYTLHENVNEVVLNCTVVDENGRLVDGLKSRDFRVLEDGVPQTIESFQHQDLPVSLGILVDNSGSMRDKRTTINGAALDLVKLSNPKDAAFIVNFSDKAYLDQDFTSNISALERGLSHYDSRNSTALYDAVAASADELARNAKQPKQVLLIITDGADNASRLTLDQAIRRVQNLAGPVVYSIGLLYGDDKQEAQSAKTALETLSRETGGLAYFPNSLEDVDQIAQEVAKDIRDQYTLGYHSTKPASQSGYRTVSVEAKAPNRKGKLIVRTRKGYFPRKAAHAPAAQATN